MNKNIFYTSNGNINKFKNTKSLFSNYNINNNSYVTVIITNFDRPKNIPIIINRLKEISNINQIIITHGKSETYTKFKDCVNIKNFSINSLYGGAQRFFLLEHILNNFVLFLDDDILIKSSLFYSLLDSIRESPIGIYGPVSRLCKLNKYVDTKINYNVILTGVLMTNREIIESYITNFNNYEEHLRKYKGNGEDLSFNHNFITNYNIMPKLVEGEYKLFNNNIGFTYSRVKNHRDIRKEFCTNFFSEL